VPAARRAWLAASARTLGGVAAGSLAVVLGGCASRPVPSGEWTSGRLALRVDATESRSAQNVSAGFELRGNDREGELKLLSPLGTQLAAARWASGLAVLSTGDGDRRFDNLEALSAEALGEPLPLSAWPDWLAGRPWRGAPHTRLDDGFEQLGWTVNTAALADGQLLARRAAAPAVTLRVRLDNPPAP
jgi:outer membrane lipoprotein LolB